jgi:iron complex outermembrane receptor protein
MIRTTSPVISAMLASFILTTAHAQDAASERVPERDPSMVLEEVVVTANRREQSMQEVPMSVSAFTSDFFKDTGVKNLSDLEQYTPSLKITPGTDSSAVSIRIRGIGSIGSNVGIDPSVGMFIDGVYQGRAGMSVGDLVDIERVEVLRGPQGTLYGKNTAAGAISILTMKPSTEYEGEVELTYNSEERAEIHAMVNVPFGDTGHAMRLTGYAVDGDHIYENQYTGEGVNDASKWGLKSRLLFDTESAMEGDGFGEFLITLDYAKEDNDCCGLAVLEYDGFSTLNAPSTNNPSQEFQEVLGLNAGGENIYAYTAFEDSEGFSPPKTDPFDEDNYWFDAPVTNKIEVGGVAAEWNKDIWNDNTLTFINAWRHFESDNARDGDMTAYDAVIGTDSVDFDQYSSELRITSVGGETFDYQGGLYYYYSELDNVGTFAMSKNLIDNVSLLSPFFPNGTLNTDTNNYETTSFAVFGQVVWNITEEFSATLGLRYTNEEKSREGSQLTDPPSEFLDIPPVAGPDVFYDDTRSDSNVSPAFNLRYFITPEIMTYASVSRGFKSGGFNQRREVEGSNGEFDEETATNYEIGWKGSTDDRRLQLNGTFYYVKYDDFQSQNFDGTTLSVKNAGSMESYGTELELIFVPAADMTASTAVGYNKAEYEEFENATCTVNQQINKYYIEGAAQGGIPVGSCTQDLEGVQIENAPEWTISSFIQYESDLPANLVGTARLEHSYIDEFFLDQDHDPNLVNDEVNLVNLRLTVTNRENTWDAAIWGRNLLDEEYYAVGFDIPVVGGYAAVTAPGAIYGITVSFRL